MVISKQTACGAAQLPGLGPLPETAQERAKGSPMKTTGCCTAGLPLFNGKGVVNQPKAATNPPANTPWKKDGPAMFIQPGYGSGQVGLWYFLHAPIKPGFSGLRYP